jgi:hypothetical protein
MTNDAPIPKKQPFWLIYLALLLSGVLLLGDAYNLFGLNRWSARLGIGLLYVVLALIIGKDKPAGIFGITIVIIALVITIFV